MNKNQSSKLKLITLTAMFAALTTIFTVFIKIPTPFGYVHAGDAIIYIGASILPFPFGLIIGTIGGALADIISGYAVWAIPTAIIKTLNAVPFVICAKYITSNKIINSKNLLMLIPTTIVTVGGYFVANMILYDYTAAVAELFAGWIQPAIAIVLYVAIGLSLDSIKFKQRVLSDISR